VKGGPPFYELDSPPSELQLQLRFWHFNSKVTCGQEVLQRHTEPKLKVAALEVVRIITSKLHYKPNTPDTRSDHDRCKFILRDPAYCMYCRPLARPMAWPEYHGSSHKICRAGKPVEIIVGTINCNEEPIRVVEYRATSN
jgi:hypothetical protein